MVSALWADALRDLGWTVVTVAGAGEVDRRVPGLGWPTAGDDRLGPGDLRRVIDDVDLVIVGNVCSLPLNPAASEAVAGALRGRPAVLHHYDLPWQREHLATPEGWPPRDARWRHVVINRISQSQLAERDVDATVIYNAIDVAQPRGDREGTRRALGVEDRLLLHPARAIGRKDVPAALRLAGEIGGTYWLTGPAEEGYPLDEVLAAARGPVIHRPVAEMADAYAACDAVLLPSRWEGFGQPLLEAAVHRRPIAVAGFAVAEELRGFGFQWFAAGDAAGLRAFIDAPDESLHDGNEAVVRRHFSLDRLRDDLARLLADWARW